MSKAIKLDPVDAEAATQKYIVLGTDILDQAERGEITDEKTAEKFTDLIKYCKAQWNKQEDQRKELVGPLNKVVKMLNAEFKKTQLPFVDAGDIGRTKLGAYIKKQADIQKEKDRVARVAEETRILEEAVELEEKADLLKHDGKTEEAAAVTQQAEQTLESVSTIVAAPKRRAVRGDMGGAASTRIAKKAVVTDIVAAAKAYPQLFEFKAGLAKSMMNGGIEIPGVEMQETDELVVR